MTGSAVNVRLPHQPAPLRWVPDNVASDEQFGIIQASNFDHWRTARCFRYARRSVSMVTEELGGDAPRVITFDLVPKPRFDYFRLGGCVTRCIFIRSDSWTMAKHLPDSDTGAAEPPGSAGSADPPILRTVGQAYASDPPIFWMVFQFIRSILLDFSTNNYRSGKKNFHAHRVAVMHTR